MTRLFFISYTVLIVLLLSSQRIQSCMHGRCKHIDVRYHFLRDLTKDGVVELVHYSTENQIAYMILLSL
ncbi:hypothetical protein MTR_8g091340 [Medicago truncatula]|uniref:RNA-directed DNA polymerase n=1 Tax=Medicago truncatula TaxID=3880 RepID=G7LAD9_MEDTR|nr:hypothetical protein MTR_8g091340 [Medicago truncatula]